MPVFGRSCFRIIERFRRHFGIMIGPTTLFRRSVRVIAWASAGAVAYAAGPSPAPVSAQIPQQEAAILSHLNTTLAWYHEVQRADSWNEQPQDEFYRNTQHDLTNEVVVSAFEYAHAMVVVIGDEEQPASKARSGDSREQHLATLDVAYTERLVDLKDQESALDEKLSGRQQQDRATLLAQRSVLQAEIDLERLAAAEGRLDAGRLRGYPGDVIHLHPARGGRGCAKVLVANQQISAAEPAAHYGYALLHCVTDEVAEHAPVHHGFDLEIHLDQMRAEPILIAMETPVGNDAGEHRRARALAAFGVGAGADHGIAVHHGG